MNRDAIDRHIDDLRNLQNAISDQVAGVFTEAIQHQLFATRRAFERAYHDYIKSGDTVRVVKPRQAECPECVFSADDPDHLYLHMRKTHKYKESDAAAVCSGQIEQYDKDVEELRRLTAEYTDHVVQDSFHASNTS